MHVITDNFPTAVIFYVLRRVYCETLDKIVIFSVLLFIGNEVKTCKQFIFEALNGLKYRSTEKYKNRNSVARNCQQYSQGFSQHDWQI